MDAEDCWFLGSARGCVTAGRQQYIWSCGPYYFAVLFSTVVCAGHFMLLKLFYRYFHYNYFDVVQELQVTLPEDSEEYIARARRFVTA